MLAAPLGMSSFIAPGFVPNATAPVLAIALLGLLSVILGDLAIHGLARVGRPLTTPPPMNFVSITTDHCSPINFVFFVQIQVQTRVYLVT